MARIYREMPLNSIWEGSGNIMCLDVLRAAARGAGAFAAYFAELEAARGADPRLERFVADLQRRLAAAGDSEAQARRLTESLVLALQGALLVRFAPGGVADAFCASRLAGDWGHAFGTLPAGCDLEGIIAGAAPTRE